CTASGIEAMSELQKNIWLKGKDAILVNAYISSTATWKEKGIRITQHSEFPDRPASTLTIETAEPAVFALMLKSDTVKAVTVNGMPAELRREEGYAVIKREFRNGDRIDIEIEARLHRVPLPGNARLGALKFGSVVLARLDGGPGG